VIDHVLYLIFKEKKIMKAYKINASNHNYVCMDIVIADSMGAAERIFNGKHWPRVAETIELLSANVQIEKYDEQHRDGN